ncbi:cell division protein FtsI [Actinorhabdospora filicis]|uniref:Cell division protein FtsI n=1 Tax=Actinorhabdospora filicis TaxID=1785913 RepID=A0A9W6SSI2_9ACTN|nr:penicillin-binding protein 2 [Actinorhabdospora filicis]GLZ81268.1 cell division protein FtsI [Actinorhabdospora filicis]
MNAPMRHVLMVSIGLFVLLIGNLTWLQFFQNDFYTNHPRNTRTRIAEYSSQRGAILADREAIATSVATDGELKYLRTYANGPLYANLTGYKSLDYGASGIEAAENEILAGTDDRLFVNRLTDIFSGKEQSGGNVILSVNPKVQEAMAKGINGKKGAAVAFDPQTGAILGQYSSPSYDPNPLASHDTTEVTAKITEYKDTPGNPMLDHAAQDFYPPGSTFKVVVSAALLEMGGYTADTMVPAGNSYTPPQTSHVIKNSNNQCPEAELPLKEALARSCNTTFARLCVDKIGANQLKETAAKFGFGETYTTPLNVIASKTGEMPDPPTLAQSCIGQNEVAATPFEMAMVSATIANGGARMEPHLIKELQAPDQTTLERTTASKLNQSISSSTATELQKMMFEVVNGANGTGKKAQIQGVTVGGKTGTAEHGPGVPEHGWFTGYAMGSDGKPAIAVAVFLDSPGEGGSSEATRIAGEVMKAQLGK